MITEIVTFQLKAASAVADPNSPAGRVVRDFLSTVLAAPGAQNIQAEGPLILLFLTRGAISNYETNINNLRTIIDSDRPLTSIHVAFTPSGDPSPALGAESKVGATEVVFFYFLASSDQDAIMSSFDKMRPAMERSEALAVYDGRAVEEAVPNPGPQASEGEMSKVYVNLVGWVDVAAHMRFMASEDFGQGIHYLLEINEIRHTEYLHVMLQVM
ncbi:hypothetical protein MMC11_007819 [Xylographa trunciseda]|nr:hypothetical protein [Xylographa trunciseda]